MSLRTAQRQTGSTKMRKECMQIEEREIDGREERWKIVADGVEKRRKGEVTWCETGYVTWDRSRQTWPHNQTPERVSVWAFSVMKPNGVTVDCVCVCRWQDWIFNFHSDSLQFQTMFVWISLAMMAPSNWPRPGLKGCDLKVISCEQWLCQPSSGF